MFHSLEILRTTIINCHKCPRLVHFRETVPPRASYKEQHYWRRPLPGFGDPHAWLLITGLAPAAHGGNRTGRIFTGDGTGRFLFRGLYHAGLANQPTSDSIDDGLKLFGCYATAAVKCVPPQNKPTKEEMCHCHPYYENEMALLKNLTCVLVLGKFAFDAYLLFVKKQGHSTKEISFAHGAKYTFEGLPTLYVSYHTSPHNTSTGKLTEKMFLNLLKKIKYDQNR